MDLTVGTILEGTVKSITKFGAFIALPEGHTGMVHISEIAHAYVNDIHEYLTEGQTVKVMVVAGENGKINLSIKKTQAPPQRAPISRAPAAGGRAPANRGSQGGDRRSQSAQPSGEQSFDDMLKRFMSDSDSKISGIRQYSDHKTKTRRR